MLGDIALKAEERARANANTVSLVLINNEFKMYVEQPAFPSPESNQHN